MLPEEDWPRNLDPAVLRETTKLAEINDGRLGWAGLVETSRVGNEYFMWYVPREKPSPCELRAMQEALKSLKVRVWMTIDRTKPELVRWAKFMKLEYVEPYDGTHDKYRSV